LLLERKFLRISISIFQQSALYTKSLVETVARSVTPTTSSVITEHYRPYIRWQWCHLLLFSIFSIFIADAMLWDNKSYKRR